MSSGLDKFSQPAPVVQKRPPWESIPPGTFSFLFSSLRKTLSTPARSAGQQQVLVYCGGRMCIKVNRKRLCDLREGSYPQKLFCSNSSFLGSNISWVEGAWVWNVMDAGPEDVPHVRRLLSIAGSEQMALERLIGADHARVRKFARDWGFVS